jgi:uncharacterized delta-60 repeat protein
VALAVLAALAVAAPGDLDASFDGDGRRALPEQVITATSLAIQADGKVVVAGSGGEENDFMVSRLLPTGAADATFDRDGTAGVSVGDIDQALGVGVQADGKVVVVGSTGSGEETDAAIVRLMPSGAPDPTFDGDGQKTLGSGPSDTARALVVQPDGRIVVAGTGGPSDDFWVARLLPTGALDASFNRVGVWTGDFGESDTAKSVVLQPDGKLVVAGETTLGEDVVVVRLKPDGTLDATFDGDGVKITPGPGNERVGAVLLGADGGILVAGTDGGNELSLGRVDSGGAPDRTFDLDGLAVADVGGEDIGYAAALQANGKIVVVGSTGDGSDMAVARFLPSGALDPGFSADGRMTVDFGEKETARAVALQADGKIVIAGTSGFSAVIARIDGDPVSRTTSSRPGNSVAVTPTGVAPIAGVDVSPGPLGGGPSHKGFGVPTCDGRQATIVGTSGRDLLLGTPGPDVIVGRGGADTIRAAGGDDRVCGGPGNDRLSGGTGHDRLFGGAGADILTGGRDRDLCVGAGRRTTGCEGR